MAQRPRRHNMLAVCLPGLEELLVAELRALGVKNARKDSKGAVTARVSSRELYAANVFLRSATRVYVDAFSFRADTFSLLERRLKEVDWAPWLNAERSRMSLRVSSHSSALFHTGAIEERFRRFLPPSLRSFLPEPLEQRVLVRVERDVVTVKIDASGEPLHERGWRQQTAKMPLRESVAAAVLQRSGWDPTTPLIDPCCGAGTLAIEAALRAIGAPPHAPDRAFALQAWPQFEAGTWASVQAQAEEQARAARQAAERPRSPLTIVASDRDAGAVAAATANAQRAGVAELISFRQAPLSELAPQQQAAGPPGTVVSNLPWGLRSAAAGGASTDLRNLYASLGRACRAKLPGWGLALLVADRAMARHVSPALRSELSLEVGGVRAWLMTRASWRANTRT